MFLSDRDLEFAIKSDQLVFIPPPVECDTSSIDLTLDAIETAQVWNTAKFEEREKAAGHIPSLVCPGRFVHREFGPEFCMPVPEDPNLVVYRLGRTVVIKPGGFLPWQTKEKVGTPEENPRLICFVNGKSTAARTGLLVHMTAPTIHAGWWGQVTLEIANLGPFNLQLHEGDSIAQLTVAVISSPPVRRKKAHGIAIGQSQVTGQSQL